LTDLLAVVTMAQVIKEKIRCLEYAMIVEKGIIAELVLAVKVQRNLDVKSVSTSNLSVD
jgi:hypothetical protein